MNVLIQQRFLVKKEFQIEKDGIRIKDKSIGEYQVPFERITRRISKSKMGRKIWLYSAFVFLFLSITVFISGLSSHSNKGGSIFWGILGVACLSVFSYTYKSYRFITCNDGRLILIFDSKPNKEQVDSFLDNLYMTRNEYLKNKYTKVDPDFPIDEQLYKIKWLYEEEIISEDEFNKIKKDCLDKKKGQSVGFMS